jgi:hypothetical protein
MMFLPFLSPNNFNGQSVGPVAFPDQATVNRLAGPNACIATT